MVGVAEHSPAAIRLEQPVSATDDHGWSLSVLVVDGHEDAAASLAEVLRLYGHDVRVAGTARAALRAAAEAPPDVVVLEPRLPDLDGWELALRLRERASVPPPLVVAVSGTGGPEARRRSAEAGIHLHLVKPADPEVLRGVLARFARVVAPAGRFPDAVRSAG
jgi:DNA-binding response OmpR family regulator